MTDNERSWSRTPAWKSCQYERPKLPGSYALPEPGTPDLLREESTILVAIPSDIMTVMNTDLDLAGRWREATRETFVHYINKGYEVHEIFWGDRISEYLLVHSGLSSHGTESHTRSGE